MQWFKTMTTNEYIRGVKTLGWPRFPGRFWQRNYYEHIIRNDMSLSAIRQYIANNPAQWADDHENPEGEVRGQPGRGVLHLVGILRRPGRPDLRRAFPSWRREHSRPGTSGSGNRLPADRGGSPVRT